jgi:mono/diheme cytochrome c family protein
LQWWTNAVDYPFLISGKPLFSLPANIPVTFELIVLFAGLTAFFGNIILNRLPQFSHATFAVERFKRATCDGFFISIDAADPKFDEAATRALLESNGAAEIDVCLRPAEARLPSALTWAVVVVGVLAVLPPLLTAWYRSIPKRSPRIHLIGDMDFQPKFKTQTADPMFADRRAMRPPVPGTVALGELREDEHLYLGRVDGGWARSLPMPATEELVARGRERFDVFCTVCHGYDGGGEGMVSKRAVERQEPNWVPPVSLNSSRVLDMADGQIFNTIANGAQNMPGYAAQIAPEDRWAIVLYVRALQLSRNAAADDVPEQIREKLP